MFQHLDEVGSLRGFDAVEVAKHRRPALNHVIPDIRADSVYQGIGLPPGYNGHGIVLIGITDAGFDYTHPAFYDTYERHPHRGRLGWAEAERTGATGIWLARPSSRLRRCHLPPHAIQRSMVCAIRMARTWRGIAASGGAGTVYRGWPTMPDCSSSRSTMMPVSGRLRVDATDAQAEQKRLVINMSWASMDLRDGTSLFSQTIDALAGRASSSRQPTATTGARRCTSTRVRERYRAYASASR